MKQHSPAEPKKPYDIRERLFLFACEVTQVAQFLQTCGPVAAELSPQLAKAAVSAGANVEEADDGSSPRDFVAKELIALREVKETRFRLRVARRAGFLDASHDSLIQESHELVRILARIIRNSKHRQATRLKG
jgi:four helix bundle protein